VSFSPAAEMIRQYHPLLRPLRDYELYDATVEADTTPAGRVLDLADAPSGVLVLGGKPPLHRPIDARIFCATDCEWFFIPAADDLGALGVTETDPVARGLREQLRLLEGDFLLQLTRFGPLRHLSYDAVRLLAYFFEIKRHRPGETVLVAGDEARPTLVLEGALKGPGGTFPPGSVLFEEQFCVGPGGPTIPADFVARGRTVTAELPTNAYSDLLPLDDRILARHDERWALQWNAVVGEPTEAAPDAQTIALNLVAREGTGDGPLSPAISVLVLDADGPALEARAAQTGWDPIPVVSTMAPPPVGESPLWANVG